MVSAIIVAAGKGTRMNDKLRKQYVLLAGRPVLAYSLLAFDACDLIDCIILVVPEKDIDYCWKDILAPLKLYTGAREYGACILAIPADDTLKQVDSSGFICNTLKRDDILLAQTPQAFKYDLIIKAHENARSEGFAGTDDASLVERLGGKIKVIYGSRQNIKITTREDLIFAKALVP